VSGLIRICSFNNME